MVRAAPQALSSLVGKLPIGWAFSRRGGLMDAVLSAPASGVLRAEAEAEQIMMEVDPRTATQLLDDFERVLGPDPCGRDDATQTLDQRQRLAHQRWTARGGQSIPYLIDIAADLGVSIAVEEYWPSVAGGAEAGEPLIGDGEQFTFTIRLGLIGEWSFIVGQNVTGETLGGLTLSDIECEIRRIKPAHTQVVFSYVE